MQDRLRWSGAVHGHISLLISACLLTTSSSSIFPHFFLPKLPWPFSFPVFGFSSKTPIINLVQSQNTLPLHRVVCPTPPGSAPSAQRVLWRAAIIAAGCHPWHMGLMAPLGQPWEGPCPFPWLGYVVLLPAIVPLSSFVSVESFLSRFLSQKLAKYFCQTWIWPCSFVAETQTMPRNWGQALT